MKEFPICFNRKRNGFLLFFLGLMLWVVFPAHSQPVYQWSGKQITVGWNNPIFAKKLEYDPITSSAQLNVQWPLGKTGYIRGTLPWIYFQRPDNHALLLGNPSIGWIKKGTGLLNYHFDLSFPVVDDTTGESEFVQSRISYPDRGQYYHKTWLLRGGIVYHKNIYRNWSVDLQGALESAFSERMSEVNLYLDYGLSIRREQRQIHYDFSWRGSLLAFGNRGTLGEDWGHLLQLGFGFRTALVDPRLHFSLPLHKELSQDVEYVIGVSLTVDIGKMRWPGD